MDNSVFIVNNEVVESLDNTFICDKKIAKSVALLNKKGYKTRSGCEGHNIRLSANIPFWVR